MIQVSSGVFFSVGLYISYWHVDLREGCYLRLIACRPGEGRTGRTLRSSSGPTSVFFSLVYGRPYPAYRLQAPLPPLSLFVCFSRGGLGVGEKPTRGELVRSTHRVPSPFISSQRFPFEAFRVNHGILWGLQQLMALSSPLCIIRLC